MWYGHHDAGWGWGWAWMIVVMAIVWVPLLIAFIWFVRAGARHDDGSGRRGSASGGAGDAPRPSGELDAREIARRAYARGDLERERFLQIMQDLGGGSGGSASSSGTGGAPGGGAPPPPAG